MSITTFIEKVCVQTAVYWGNPQDDGYGKYTFDAAVEIDCRWEGKVAVVLDRMGKEVMTDAQVMVTQDLDIGGFLYLGSLDDLSSEPDPYEVEDAYEIMAFEKIPLFCSTDEFVRKAFLNEGNLK